MSLRRGRRHAASAIPASAATAKEIRSLISCIAHPRLLSWSVTRSTTSLGLSLPQSSIALTFCGLWHWGPTRSDGVSKQRVLDHFLAPCHVTDDGTEAWHTVLPPIIRMHLERGLVLRLFPCRRPLHGLWLARLLLLVNAQESSAILQVLLLIAHEQSEVLFASVSAAQGVIGHVRKLVLAVAHAFGESCTPLVLGQPLVFVREHLVRLTRVRCTVGRRTVGWRRRYMLRAEDAIGRRHVLLHGSKVCAHSDPTPGPHSRLHKPAPLALTTALGLA